MNNSPSAVVLDASALIALIQEENGSEIIKPLLKYAVMSSVNVAETLIALQKRGLLYQQSLILIQDIIGSIIPFNLKHVELVAQLQTLTQHKGLSLGDKACIALGIATSYPIYTADKIWAELELNCQIIVIR